MGVLLELRHNRGSIAMQHNATSLCVCLSLVCSFSRKKTFIPHFQSSFDFGGTTFSSLRLVEKKLSPCRCGRTWAGENLVPWDNDGHSKKDDGHNKPCRRATVNHPSKQAHAGDLCEVHKKTENVRHHFTGSSIGPAQHISSSALFEISHSGEDSCRSSSTRYHAHPP